MNNEIVLSGLIVGVLIIMFYIPYLLAKGLTQLCYDKKLTVQQQIKCMIPVYNVFYADSIYWGKLYLSGWSFIVLFVVAVIRVLTWYFMYSNEIVAQIFIIGLWVAVAAWWICNVVNSFMIMKDSTVVPVGKAILFSIIFPMGYFYIGNFLVNVMIHELNSQEDSSWDLDGEEF